MKSSTVAVRASGPGGARPEGARHGEIGAEGEPVAPRGHEVRQHPPVPGDEVDVRRPPTVGVLLGVDVLEARAVAADDDQVQPLLVLHLVVGDRGAVGSGHREGEGDGAARLGPGGLEGEGVAVLGHHQPARQVRDQVRTHLLVARRLGRVDRAHRPADAEGEREGGHQADDERGDPDRRAHQTRW